MLVRNRLAGALAVLMGAVPRTVVGQEPFVEGSGNVTPVLRTTIFVRDLDESVNLYRDILGLQTRVELVLEGDLTNQILGTEGKKVRVLILQSGDTMTGNVGLFAYDDTEVSPPEQIMRTEVRTGDVALVFVTDDIQGIYQKVKTQGYTVVSPPMVLFPQSDTSQESLEMLFFDRDGIGINLIQRNVSNRY